MEKCKHIIGSFKTGLIIAGAAVVLDGCGKQTDGSTSYSNVTWEELYRMSPGLEKQMTENLQVYSNYLARGGVPLDRLR